jgi:hypothetical protein
MPAATVDQLALDEKVIEDAALESLLDEWLSAREDASTASADLRAARKRIEREAEKLDMGIDTAIRIGRFRIERRMRAARDVEFHTEAKDQLSIKLIEDAA